MTKTTIERQAQSIAFHHHATAYTDIIALTRDIVAFAHRERAAALREAADWRAPEQWKLVDMLRAFADAEERLANV